MTRHGRAVTWPHLAHARSDPAAPGDEGDAIGRLAQHADGQGRFRNLRRDLTKTDGAKFAHGTPRCMTYGTATLPGCGGPVKRRGARRPPGRLVIGLRARL